ncbi:ornithine decarboxylase isoform X1 [Ixodes scapularis]|uniref:ornithine decarboxylase isoform X1 n=2 Tax=Ixodes scapularis TaxID=6945 RepID=UPI001C390C6C|nr:ornithine decarboxylase isoform X1 [Ixodes scapularis]
MGKEAVSWPATVHANGIHHKTAEQLHQDIMRDAVKFSNAQPRTFAQQLSTQGGKDDLEHPFYVVDIDDLFYRMDLWRKSIPRAAPYYAVKCNDNPVVLEVLAGSGLGFDCASINEIETMIALGVDPSRIIYAHPQKHVSFIRRARDLGVDLVTFDSSEELYKIKEHYPTCRLVLRLRVDNDKAWFAMGDKFGCTDKEAVQLLRLAKDLQLAVVGICFHVGSSNQDPTAFAGAIAGARRAFDAARAMGFDVTLLDIGGGYPGEKESEPIFLKTADIINEGLEKYFPESYGVNIISEPGTFFVHSAFTLFAKIIGKRINEGQNNTKPRQMMYYINESVYKSFVVSLFNDDPVEPLPLVDSDGPLHESIVWGITCDGLDKIKASCKLPELSVGQWLMFENMGAYTITLNTPFNGFPSADIVYRSSKLVEDHLRRHKLIQHIIDSA